MAKTAGTLTVDVQANVARMQKDLQKIGKNVDQWGKRYKKSFAQTWQGMAVGIASVIQIGNTAGRAFRALNRQVSDLTDAAKRQQDSEVALQAALRTTGRDVEALFPPLKSFASHLQSVTKYGDEVVMESTALLAQLTKLDREGLKRATEGAVGLATVYKQDLKAASTLVGKALAGNYGALSRYGIMVERTMTDEEKRASILRQLTIMYERAKQETLSFSGVQQQLSNLYGDLKEKVGSFIVENEALVRILRDAKDWLVDVNEQLGKWIEANKDLIEQKTEEILRKILDVAKDLPEKLGNIAAKLSDIYMAANKLVNLVPEATKGVGAGLIGRIIFGSWKPAAVITALTLANEVLAKTGNNLGKIPSQAKDAYEALKNIFDALSGKKDWMTGESLEWDVGILKHKRPPEQLGSPLPLISFPRGVPTPPPGLSDEERKQLEFISKLKKEIYKEDMKRLAAVMKEQDKYIEQGLKYYEDWKKASTEYEEILLPAKRSTDFWVGMVEKAQYFGKNTREIMAAIFSPEWQANFWLGMWDKAKAFAGKFLGLLKKGIDIGIASAKWLITLPNRITESLTEFSAAITNFPAIIADFRKTSQEFINNLPSMVDSLVEASDEFISALIDKLPELIDSLLSQIPKIVRVLTEKIIPAFIMKIPLIIRSVISNIPAIINAFIAGVPNIIYALVTSAPRIVNELIVGIVKGIPQIISGFISQIPKIVSELIKAIWHQIPILGGGAGIFEGLPIIGDILGPVGKIVKKIPIIGDLFHGGGIVGQGQSLVRPMPAMAFAGAPHARFGLAPDERPIIAHKDEGVFTPAQMAALGQPRDQVIQNHITINLDGKKLGTWIYDGTRSGSINIHERSIVRR